MGKATPPSLDQIRPFFQVVVFRKAGRDFDPRAIVRYITDAEGELDLKIGQPLKRFTVSMISSEHPKYVYFVRHRSLPTWLRRETVRIIDEENDIIIIYVHKEHIFAHSNCPVLVDCVNSFFHENKFETIDSRNLLNLINQKDLQFRTLGIQNIFSAGGLAPEGKSYYGRDTKYSLSPTYDGGFGFSYCLALEQVDKRRTKPFGCSIKKNKIWQTWVSDLDEFTKACREIDDLLDAESKEPTLSALVRPLQEPPKTLRVVGFYLDFNVYKKGMIALSFDSGPFELSWDAHLSESQPDEIVLVSYSPRRTHSLKVTQDKEKWSFSFIDDGSIALRFCEDEGSLDTGRTRNLDEYLNENENFTLLFENGIGYRDGLYWEDNRMKMPFEKSASPISWKGTDITKESKTKGRHDTIADAIERHFAKALIGINDDGANEAADFIIVKESRFILVHSKYSEKRTKDLRVGDLQVVCSQALKNLRFFIPQAAKTKLASWSDKQFTSKKMELAKLESALLRHLRNPQVRKECWIVQPGISKKALEDDPKNKIHVLLNHVDSVCSSQNIHFQLVCNT